MKTKRRKSRTLRGTDQILGAPKNQVIETLKTGAFVGAGVALGMVLNKGMDKAIEVVGDAIPATTNFFAGLQMKSNVAKWAKPAVKTLLGVGGVVLGLRLKKDFVAAISSGVIISGVDGLVGAATGKTLLSGFGELPSANLDFPALPSGYANPLALTEEVIDYSQVSGYEDVVDMY